MCSRFSGVALGIGMAFGGGGACYHPEPLDARALLTELRASDPPAAPGASSSVAAAPASLSEDRSVALALLWNRDLRAFRLTRGIAEGEVITAGELQNPQLRMELTHLQRADLAQLGWDARLSWEPPQPGVRAGRRGAASAHLEEVERQISEREWALGCDVRMAHVALLALDEQIRVAQDTVTNRQRLAEVVTRRVERGGTTRFDLDLVRLSLASAERIEGERHLARTLAASTLVQLIGVGPPGGAIMATGELHEDTANAPALNQAEIEDRAFDNRPALAAARARYRMSEETLRAETAARWPWLRLSAAPRVRRNEFFGANTDLVVGVDVTLPIFNTNGGRFQSAKSARDVARAEVMTELVGVRADIARAAASVEAQRAILKRLHTEVEPLLAEHDRLMSVASQATELDLPSLIASEDLVLKSRIELIDARLELRRAWIALERAVGAHVNGSAAPGK